MHQKLLSEKIVVPSGISVKENLGTFTVKGPKGEVSRRLFHPKIRFEVTGEKVVINCENATLREKKMVYTIAAHLRNLIKGAEHGFTYKLKVCSGHFPMTVAVKGDVLEVKNFIGEAVPRKLKLNPAVKVTTDGQIVTVEGSDIEMTGQQASRIEQLCRRTAFDRRIFQDGIYIISKGEDE